MMRIYPTSLSQTVDSVNTAFFFGDTIPANEREEVALWIAQRQGLAGCYANMFAPTSAEQKNGIRLFTGETIGPSASLRHVSGEEACRALILLNAKSKAVKGALDRATEGMVAALARAEAQKRDWFCCGTCDPALWRHITAGGLQGSENWLAKGMKLLKEHRDGKGKWRRFPFFYTLLALSEIDLPASKQEMRYTAAVCERYLKRTSAANPFLQRKRMLVERVLASI